MTSHPPEGAHYGDSGPGAATSPRTAWRRRIRDAALLTAAAAGLAGTLAALADLMISRLPMHYSILPNRGLENGLKYMRGPANPSSNDSYAMLIEGFDDSPRLLMPYNPEYYVKLCENYGMKKAKDMYAWKLVNEKLMASEKLKRGQELVRKRYDVKISQLDMKNFQRDLEKFKFVYNKAWAPNWGFVPMTEEQIDAMAKDMKPIAEPSLVLFGEIDGKLIGAALVMLDYNIIFKTMNGRLFPFNFIKLFTLKKKINWARILTLGIIPEHQKKGLDTIFYWDIVNRAANIGIRLGEASWVLEENDMMNRGLELMNAERYKKYRIWEVEV